jgi:membrane fusion protein (multidrug efflux system)
MAEEKTKPNGADAGKKRSRRRKRIIIPLSLLILAGAIIAVYWYVYLRGYVSTDDAFIDGDEITVSSKILGRITFLGAAEGDSVSLGQLLVLLDDRDLKAQEAQAKANLEHVRQNVPVARITVERAQEDFDRVSFQYKNKVVPREQFDHSRKALELSKAQYEVALSQVTASAAQLEVIETQLTNTRVVAPLSGVVAKKWVVLGDIVQPGQPIFTMYNLRDVWVTANYEETKLGAIHVGDPARITVDAYGGSEFDGMVLLVGAAAASRFSLIPPNNASGNFTKVTQRIPIRISIEPAGPDAADESFSLLPGMSVVVKIRVKRM